MTTVVADRPATAESSHEFVKALTLTDATMLVAGSMIGSGIFIVSANIARRVGSPFWLLIVVDRHRRHDAARRARVRRAGGDVSASRRPVRVSPRVHGSTHGLSLRVDPFRRHPDGHDRRGRRRLRTIPRRALAGDLARSLCAGFRRPICAFATAGRHRSSERFSSGSRRSGSSRSSPCGCSRGSTCAACARGSSSRRRSRS